MIAPFSPRTRAARSARDALPKQKSPPFYFQIAWLRAVILLIHNFYVHQADTQIRPGASESISREEATRLARTHAKSAVRLDPRDPWSHAELANVALQLNLDYKAAEDGYRQAIRLQPDGSGVAWYYSQIARSFLYRGDLQSALTHFERSISTDDSLGQAYQLYAAALLNAREWEKAARLCDVGLELTASGFDAAVFRLFKSRAMLGLGNQEEAERQVQLAMDLIGLQAPYTMPYALAAVGRKEEAEQIVEDMLTRSDMNSGLMVYAMLAIGDIDRAFEWLNRAIEDRNQLLVEYIRIDTAFAFSEMRTDSRWPSILAHLEAVELESRQGASAHSEPLVSTQ